MTGLVATLIGHGFAGGLLVAALPCGSQAIGLSRKAIALSKLRHALRLHLPDRKRTAHTPGANAGLSFTSTLASPVLTPQCCGAALDRHCLHVLQSKTISARCCPVRCAAVRPHRACRKTIPPSRRHFPKARSRFTPDFRRTSNPLGNADPPTGSSGGLARKHGAKLQALHVARLRVLALVGAPRSEAPQAPPAAAEAGAVGHCSICPIRAAGTARPIRATKTGFMTCWRWPGLPAMTSIAACSWHFAMPPTAMARRGRCSRTRWAAS
jgi:hypothetical protein